MSATQQASATTTSNADVNATPQVTPPAETANPPAQQAATEPAATTTTTETKAPEATAEIKYELKLPDGSKLSADHVKQVETYAKELGLNNDAAQKLLTRESELASNTEAQLAKEHEDQVKSWQDAAKNDKEIGGEKFGENKELAFRALDKFGTPEFKKMLQDFGYEHHPEVLRAFVRIGKAMSDDRISQAGTQSTLSGKTVASKLYDHPTSQQK